jgi:hypothetical protein
MSAPFSIEVEGSRGAVYVVTRRADGSWHCQCESFRRRHGALCKHVLSMHRPEPVANAPVAALLRGVA